MEQRVEVAPTALEIAPTLVEPVTKGVAFTQQPDGSFQYLVEGQPNIFIGIGYNPVYRNDPFEQRAANYDRDFRLLCEAGVNHITGWDADKGYEQDRFDELTLDYAQRYGLGVVMPLNLPPEAAYADARVREDIIAEAKEKLYRFRDHPALRMWGVGNEVLTEMEWEEDRLSFLQFYVELIDLFHEIDPYHPVIYREAEDIYVPTIMRFLQENGGERPWFLYGMNVYSERLQELIDAWPSHEFGRPLIVTEFGAEPDWEGGRAEGYARMWRQIRSRPTYALGGAPYAWWVDGPEPTDKKWGLVDGISQPVDGTFAGLAAEWRKEPLRNTSCAPR